MRLLKLVPDNTNVRFLRYRWPALAISLLLLIVSVALVFTKGLNYGVDFAGGQEIRMTFTQQAEAPVGQLRETVGALGLGEPTIQRFGAPNEVSIRTKLPESAQDDPGAAERISRQIIESVQNEHADVRIDGVDTVSGKVSSEFRDKAIYVVLASMVGVALYIWIRFEWQFGVGALLALFHDVVLAVGLFSLLQWEFSLQIVAALLALVAYSLNDTIVIYDRIRENLKKYRKMPIIELLDLSLNETLARTVMTSLTFFAALLPLLLFGPASLFGLTVTIVFGIAVGTFSSIFMAAPLLLWLKVDSNSFVSKESDVDKQERLARGQG